MTITPLDLEKVNRLSLSEAAAEYCRMGFKILPCRPGGKAPVKGWKWTEYALSDPQDAKALWENDFPNANIGLIMGKVSGVMALDIDVGKSDGWRSLGSIIDVLSAVTSPIQETPSRGSHILYLYQSGLTNFTGKGTARGLDMRTDNGYIVGAPSVIEGRAYYWRNGPLEPMPDALWAACLEWSSGRTVKHSPAPELRITEEHSPAPELRITEEQAADYIAQLPEADQRFLLFGENDRPDQNDSARIYHAVRGLLRLKLPPDLILAILDHTYMVEIAARHTGTSQ